MKKFFVSLVAILSILVLVGCGDGNTDDRITITFWHAMGQNNQKVISEMISSFEDKYPNVKVKADSQGGYDELLKKIQDNLKAGSGPVIAQTYPDHVVSYLTSSNAVVDLTTYAFDPEVGFDAQGVDPNQYVKSFWDEGYKYDDKGSLYSMPFNKSTEVLFYNKTIFSKYDWFVTLLGYDSNAVYSEYTPNTTDKDGKLVPSKKVYRNDFIWKPTWEEIIKIAEAYKETSEYSAPEKDANGNDVQVQRYALGYDSISNLFITLTQQFAARDENKAYGQKGENAYVSLNPTTRKGEFTFLNENNPYPQQAINFFNEQYKLKHFATSAICTGGYCSDYFKSGRFIMTVGSSAGTSYNDPAGKFDAGVATYPQFADAKEEEKQVIQQGTNLTLFTKDDKEVEKYGWLLILHMTNYENAKLWSTGTAYFPTRSDVYESVEYQDYLQGKIEDATGQAIYEQGLIQKAMITGWEQKDWFFTNVVFNGTDVARAAAEGIVTTVVNNGGTMASAFASAKDALKNYIVK